jgi:glycosyltransferase involved in cell wall biosynthesis
LTSLWEDPGFVLVEAASLNKLIISSNCKNGPEEFLDYGKGGLLFKSNSVDSLIKNIETAMKLKESDYKKMILQSKKQTRKYLIFNHYKKIESILRNEN